MMFKYWATILWKKEEADMVCPEQGDDAIMDDQYSCVNIVHNYNQTPEQVSEFFQGEVKVYPVIISYVEFNFGWKSHVGETMISVKMGKVDKNGAMGERKMNYLTSSQ